MQAAASFFIIISSVSVPRLWEWSFSAGSGFIFHLHPVSFCAPVSERGFSAGSCFIFHHHQFSFLNPVWEGSVSAGSGFISPHHRLSFCALFWEWSFSAGSCFIFLHHQLRSQLQSVREVSVQAAVSVFEIISSVCQLQSGRSASALQRRICLLTTVVRDFSCSRLLATIQVQQRKFS